MKWYFCLNEAATGWFSDMVKAAVVSAAKNTTLSPHCIYDGAETELTFWLRGRGVTIHSGQVPFRERLFSADVRERNSGNGFDPEAACGFYLPLQIADVEREDRHVLFTDCDVMFLQRPNVERRMPLWLSAAPEVASLDDPNPRHVQARFNSGVLVLNVAALRRNMRRVRRALERNGYFEFPEAHATYDQGLLNTVFRYRWRKLPQEVNWRVFFGVNPHARIVHWHGPKPIHVADLLSGRTSGPSYTSPAVIKLMIGRTEAYRHYYSLFTDFLRDA